jgi:NADPH:quinone reductase-like Zn-dependent oxidoreductase
MSYQRVVITQFGSSEVLKVIEESELPKPKPGEVRVKVLASGVAFTDIMIREGKYPGIKAKPPFSPGYDMVGMGEGHGGGGYKV